MGQMSYSDMNIVTKESLMLEKPIDTYFLEDKFLKWAMQRKVVQGLESFQSPKGYSFKFPFIVDGGNAYSYDGDNFQPIGTKSILDYGELSWRYAAADFAYKHTDKIANRGEAKVIEFMKLGVEVAAKTLKKKVGDMAWVTQAGTDWESVYDIFTADIYAGIDSSGGVRTTPGTSHGWNQPYKESAASTSAEDIIVLMNNMLYWVEYYGGSRPDALLMNNATYNLLFKAMFGKTGFMSSLNDTHNMELGFGGQIGFNGIPIIRNENVPAKKIWWANSQYMGLLLNPEESWTMDEDGWHRIDPDSRTVGARWLVCGNWLCTWRGALGVGTLL
jgi:hypothetical protein